MNADWAPGGRQPSDKTNRFGLWVRRKIGCYHPQTPSPFIIITQLVSWYSFYRPTQGGRLSRPRHYSKGAQPVPKAVYLSDCRDKHDRPRWDWNLGSLAPQSGVLPLKPPRPAGHRNVRSVCTVTMTSPWTMDIPINFKVIGSRSRLQEQKSMFVYRVRRNSPYFCVF